MSKVTKQAEEKLNAEIKAFEGDVYGKVVYKDLAATLKQFCGKDWFAQAIVDSGKTLSDCCKEILSDVQGGISDVETYKRAVEFYVPGSTVTCQMQVVHNWEDVREPSAADSGEIVSLLDLL